MYIEYLKEVQTRLLEFHTTKLGISMTNAEEEESVSLIRKNIDLFTWIPSNILGIDTRVVFYRLAINSTVRSVVQRKQKVV